MIKTSLMLALLALVARPALAATADDACLTTFYQTKDMACVERVIQNLPQEHTAADKKPEALVNPAMLGFLAEIFSAYPDEKTHLLSLDVPPKTKLLFIEALYEADLADEAQTYAKDGVYISVVQHLKDQGAVPVKKLQPVFIADNDVLIGAFMASGNTDFIKNLLSTYTKADDEMVHEGLRLGMMQSKFGPAAAPPNRATKLLPAICAKYDCKQSQKGMEQVKRVMLMSTGFWAMHSLAQHDDKVKTTFNDFFTNDPRLKNIFTEENTGFGNYLVTYAATTAIKDNPGMESSLSIYENLGSPKEAADAMMKK